MRATEFATERKRNRRRRAIAGPYYYGWFGDGTSSGETAVSEASANKKFIIYINGVPATTYDSLVDAKKDLYFYQYAMPNKKFMIYQEVCQDQPIKETQGLDKPTPSIEEIANKHNVDIDYVVKQLIDGLRVELEHTSDLRIAKEIALDHINERPDYYQRLRQVE